jgi:hypothetical protein
MVKVVVIFSRRERIRKYPPFPFFQVPKYQHPVDNPNKPQQQWLCCFMHFFCKKYFGQIQENQ